MEITLLLTLIMMLSVINACEGQSANSLQLTGTGGGRPVISISSMTAKRATHTAVMLGNGKVLIAGGFVAGGRSLARA